MSILKLGVDVGNSDTKSQNTSIASGYQKYANKPLIAKKILEYENQYYVAEDEYRFPPKKDKMENDHCFILTLMSIAEEIMFQLHEKLGTCNPELLQKKISEISEIKLGIGLPPGHFSDPLKGAASLTKYYEEKFSDGIIFNYDGFDFSFKVSKIRAFPQDFIAMYSCPDAFIPKHYKSSKYTIIGIGGGTTDIVPIINNTPDVNNCRSLIMGSRIMYDKIISSVQRNTGEALLESDIERVLMGEMTILPAQIKEIIKSSADDFAKNIIDTVSQSGVNFISTPIVFFGGGCLLIKETLNDIMKTIHPETTSETEQQYWEFVSDRNANAKAYAKFVD